MNNRIRWRFGALASAIALLGSLASLDAHALGLGRISVQSALGEALRAEIDILEISADETASLRVGVAPAEAFRAAGLEYSAAVVSVQVSLQKRPDGRSYLRLSSPRPITDPFVDLILEASWASGRVVRDYTMLFDPPSTRQSGGAGAPAVPTAPLLSRPATPSSPSASDARTSPPSAATRPAARPVPVVKAPPARPGSEPKPPATGQQVAVSKGDTAGKIAAQNKPASVSLDQMLVALLRNNPDAFIGGNINRLKSGAVLDIPAEGDAQTVSAGDASRSIVAQAKDFNEFRRKLAEGIPATQMGNASRQAGGKLQARVDDRAPATTTPDKLTLSKGAVQGKAAAEDAIAKQRQAKDASNRVAELSKNIGDLNKLAGLPPVAAAASSAQGPGVSVVKPGVAPAPASPATSASAAVPAAAASAGKAALPVPAEAAIAPGIAAVSPTPTLATTPTATAGAMAGVSAPAASASSPASAASSASEGVAAASPASAPAPVAVKKPVAPPPPEPGLFDELTDNPLVLPLAGGLLLLLAGLGIYRYKKRSNPGQIDSSFLESRLQPDSFFGASGGQRIDTNEGGATGSSLVYSPSQLDAAGDVDPVAEADVYLAYGRDLQAEEILKEALRTNPTRVAVHAKLMEIYAKRRDLKGFEAIAIEAFSLTRGSGPEWAYIGEMGRELDPANLLYQPGGRPPVENRADVNKTSASQASFGSDTLPDTVSMERAGPANSSDLDLDLDFSLGDEPAAQIAPPAPAKPTISAPAYQPEPTVAMKAVEDPIFEGLDMDFGADIPVPKPVAEAPMSDGLTFTSEPVVAASKAPPRPAAVALAAAPDSGMLEFDLDSLSLDLDGPTTQSPTSAAVAHAASDDPLETKFALAEEFRALGDLDGARSLADEVVAQAGLPLKTKAQAFLNALA